MRYRTKFVDGIEAIQVLDDNAAEVRAFIQQHDPGPRHQDGYDRRAGSLWVRASQAWCDIRVGDYVMAERSSPGVYPCRREDFEARYEASQDPPGHLSPDAVEHYRRLYREDLGGRLAPLRPRGRPRLRAGAAMTDTDSDLIEWTAADSGAAYKEGWDIFECSAYGHDAWEVQRDDDAAILEDDADAWKLIVDGAAAGSPLHVKALAFLKQHAPGEHALITSSDPTHHPRCDVVVYPDLAPSGQCGTPLYPLADGTLACPFDHEVSGQD